MMFDATIDMPALARADRHSARGAALGSPVTAPGTGSALPFQGQVSRQHLRDVFHPTAPAATDLPIDADGEERHRVRRGQSCAADAGEAAREFYAQVVQPDIALVIFFCSAEYDLDVIARELRRLFVGVQVIGCTTAGEFGPAGYRDHSIAGASFPAQTFSVASRGIERLQDLSSAQVQSLGRDVLRDLQAIEPRTDTTNTFAFLMIDGVSGCEELVALALHVALGEIPLVGGSAGDGLAFGTTRVYFDGAFHTNATVVALVTTSLQFQIFKTQHFVPTQERVVVTSADTETRTVRKINGRVAADEYAALVGVSVESLDPMRFVDQPMVVMIDGTSYVRSIQKVNPDGSLTLFCAIEEGIVLRAARGVDLIDNLTQAFAGIAASVGEPQIVIGCDCVLRKLEILQSGLVEKVQAIFRAGNAVGFNSYGEQYQGVHVNQTFTGIAIGDDFR